MPTMAISQYIFCIQKNSQNLSNLSEYDGLFEAKVDETPTTDSILRHQNKISKYNE